MKQDIPQIPNILSLSLAFYGFFLLVSVLLIYFFDINWRAWLNFDPLALLGYLLIGAIAAYGVVKLESIWGFGNTRLGSDFALLIKMMGRQTVPVLLLISLCAGIFEEMLFRGVLQPLAIEQFGLIPGLLGVAVLFGLLHFVSFSYFTFATFVGLIAGMLFYRGTDLLSLMVLHASYDFVALYLGMYVYDLGSDEPSIEA